MTLFGIDISHFQRGLSLADVRSQGYDFVIAKASEGQGMKDETFHGFRKDAKREKLLFAAYHFLRSDSRVSAQADNLAEQLEGHEAIPVMIDCEPTADGSRPTMNHVKQFMTACERRNLNVTILYLPSFHFHGLGKPTIPETKGFWQALYGTNPRGFGSAIYPGDTSPRWKRMGGRTPDILQFGSKGKITGFKGRVDVNAFRGTRDELVATGLFSGPPAGGRSMPATVSVGTGDTIESIARASGLKVGRLWRLNRPDIRRGESLKVR